MQKIERKMQKIVFKLQFLKSPNSPHCPQKKDCRK